jgi:hypothetical protein
MMLLGVDFQVRRRKSEKECNVSGTAKKCKSGQVID